MLDCRPVPGADFWLDWSLSASVEQLRRLLPELAKAAGYRIDEQVSAATGPGWATFALRSTRIAEPIGQIWYAQETEPVEVDGATACVAAVRECGARVGVVSNIWAPYEAGFRRAVFSAQWPGAAEQV